MSSVAAVIAVLIIFLILCAVETRHRLRDKADEARARAALSRAIWQAQHVNCPRCQVRDGQLIPCDTHDVRLWARFEQEMKR